MHGQKNIKLYSKTFTQCVPGNNLHVPVAIGSNEAIFCKKSFKIN